MTIEDPGGPYGELEQRRAGHIEQDAPLSASPTPPEKLARMIATGERLSAIARTRYSRWSTFVCWLRGQHRVDVPQSGFYKATCQRCGKTLEGFFFAKGEW